MIDAEECRRLNSEGWSHRKLAAHYGVPLRHVQKVLFPEKRKLWDKNNNRRRTERAKAGGNEAWSWSDIKFQ